MHEPCFLSFSLGRKTSKVSQICVWAVAGSAVVVVLACTLGSLSLSLSLPLFWCHLLLANDVSPVIISGTLRSFPFLMLILLLLWFCFLPSKRKGGFYFPKKIFLVHSWNEKRRVRRQIVPIWESTGVKEKKGREKLFPFSFDVSSSCHFVFFFYVHQIVFLTYPPL